MGQESPDAVLGYASYVANAIVPRRAGTRRKQSLARKGGTPPSTRLDRWPQQAWRSTPYPRRMCVFSAEMRARLPDHHRYFMDVIESNLRLWIGRHARYAELASNVAEQLKDASHTSAALLIASQAAGLAGRIVGLTESFIGLVNDDQVYGAPPVVRSLYETCCVPCYVAREVAPRLRKGTGTNNVHRLLYRIGLGTGPSAGYGHIRPIGVPSLNKAANAWINDYLRSHGEIGTTAEGIAQMIYGPLSDRSHPNFGATSPGVNWGPSGPTYALRPQFDGGSIDELLSAAFFMLIVAGEALDQVVSTAEQHAMPFPPGEPKWDPADLMSPAEASVKAALSQRGEQTRASG